MSQRGNAPPPATSYHNAGTPAGSSGNAPRSQNAGDQRQQHGEGQYAPGDHRARHTPTRTLGVHNILNPSEPRAATHATGLPPPIKREREDAPPMSPHGYAAPPYMHSAPASASNPGTPHAHNGPPPIPSSSESRPPLSYGQPNAQRERKILSPRLPRAASLSYGVPPHELDPRAHQATPGLSPVKRPREEDPTEELRQRMPSRQPPSLPHTPNLPGASISRSFSQPITQPAAGPHAIPPTLPPRDVQPQLPPQMTFPPAAHGGRSFSSSATPAPQPSTTFSVWSDVIRRPGMSGSPILGGDGQQAYMALPGSDVPIPIHVDFSQASKKADEKRQRNAKASTRHRRKRKAQQEADAKELKIIKDDREEMAAQLEDMKAERDHYRNERDRLREMVLRNPSMAEHAAGPPTPQPMVRQLSAFRDLSPSLHSRHGETPSYDYASEDSSGDRPTHRQRTEDRSEHSMQSYGTPSATASTVHTPLHGPVPTHGHAPGAGPVYGLTSRPTSAASSTGGGERLPPLRSIEGPQPHPGPPPHAGPPGLGHPHEQDPATGQWVPLQQRNNVETGWATSGHRGPADGPPRQQ